MLCCAALLALTLVSPAKANQAPSDLAEMSLEELGSIEITSVSKRAERLSDAPATVFVITADDIRRSGVTSLPEALRLAPNLQVARVNSGSYAISARGFNNTIGNKLQVLMDGRILYTPLFSGVFWDTPDVMLEDVERIEVISGPGATLWGTNAVNGVINVITKRASDTQGGLASANAGNLENNHALRFGSEAGNAAYRFYGKFFERDATTRTSGISDQDGWKRGEIGFRADWGSAAEGFTLLGAAYRGELDTESAEDLRISGSHLLARWNGRLASGGNVQLQGYLDQSHRDIPGSVRERLRIHDLEFQHQVAGLGEHVLVWGINRHGARDDVENAPTVAFYPAERNLDWTSVFAHGEYALDGERLRLIGGARVERNSYTGNEFLPDLRLAWKPGPSQSVWLGVTRAVRTPSRLDRELFLPAQPPFSIAGGPQFRSEVLTAYQVSYRAQPSPRVSYSVTAYRHDYDHLRTIERQPDGAFVLSNQMHGHGNGVEAWGTVQATDNWRLSAGATWLDLDLRLKQGSTDPNGVRVAGNDPEYQWMLRSSLDLPGRLQLDALVRRVGALSAPRVPAYTAVDASLGWRPTDRWELSLTAQNLLDSAHVEFGNPSTASEIERGVRVGVKWTF